MEVTATEAKNRLGQMLDHCQSEPVVIEKSGHRHSALLSAAQYDALVAAGKPAARRGDAGKVLYTQYTGSVDEQNRLVEQYGSPGKNFRAW